MANKTLNYKFDGNFKEVNKQLDAFIENVRKRGCYNLCIKNIKSKDFAKRYKINKDDIDFDPEYWGVKFSYKGKELYCTGDSWEETVTFNVEEQDINFEVNFDGNFNNINKYLESMIEIMNKDNYPALLIISNIVPANFNSTYDMKEITENIYSKWYSNFEYNNETFYAVGNSFSGEITICLDESALEDAK